MNACRLSLLARRLGRAVRKPQISATVSIEQTIRHSGRSSAWTERCVRDAEAEGSNPFAPTFQKYLPQKGLRRFIRDPFWHFLASVIPLVIPFRRQTGQLGGQRRDPFLGDSSCQFASWASGIRTAALRGEYPGTRISAQSPQFTGGTSWASSQAGVRQKRPSSSKRAFDANTCPLGRGPAMSF